MTRREAAANMKQAIALHLKGLHEDGLPVPEPSSSTGYVEV